MPNWVLLLMGQLFQPGHLAPESFKTVVQNALLAFGQGLGSRGTGALQSFQSLPSSVCVSAARRSCVPAPKAGNFNNHGVLRKPIPI